MSKLALQLISKNKKNKSTTLDLGNCDLIAVPSKVSQMDWLTSLSLRGNDDLGTEISDLAPLTGLVSLRTLGIYGTQVSDLTSLSGLVNLHWLVLSDTRVSDLTPLSGLLSLKALDISGTQVSDLTPLSGLMNLETVDISGMQVSDLTPLSSLMNLETLDISGTQVSDLTPLSGLMRLKSLSVAGTQVSDLTPLAGLMNLCEFTPTMGEDKVPRRELRTLEVMAEVARAKVKEKTLRQIAEARFQETGEISSCLSHALRLLMRYDPYPRDAPLWQHVDRMQWVTRISQNAELVLHKVDLVHRVLAASARWKATSQEAKLQLQMGADLPLPAYLLDLLKGLNLTRVRDLIATTRTVLKAGDFDQEDVHLLERYLDWYGLHFQGLHADVKISNDLSMRSVSDLGLQHRTFNALKDEKIDTVGDLVRRSENDLLRAPNLGRKAVNEIREKLAELGLHFAVD